jgi:hypothetical protein
MPKSRASGASKVFAQLSKLGMAAPQVVAHRVGRMATSGPVMSARDRQEFSGMVSEKQLALTQSMQSMWLAGAKAHQDFWVTYSRSLLQPPWLKSHTNSQLAKQVQQAGFNLLSEGLAPFERKASSNAKRLAKSKKR